MSKQCSFCIVAVGYNRPNAMRRLLASISAADYGSDKVDLLVSVDCGQLQAEIVSLAEDFLWKYGTKNIRAFSERQGLRSHILQCGDVVLNYDAIIILEDDITVCESFYSYAKQAAKFYENESKVAGISLYKHCINVGVGAFFEPEYNGYDTFMMQYAQSWGQCWTKKMWNDFRQWYEKNSKDVFSDSRLMKKIPSNIRKWKEQSWLKYFMAYVVMENLYFVYPYYSLSTNHSEMGQHNLLGSNDYQVSMANGDFTYRFPCFKNAVKYDVFFEREEMDIYSHDNRKIIMDLYGNKEEYSDGDILISSKRCPYKVLECWKLKYHPQEVNCRLPEQGHGLYVYDLKTIDKAPKHSVDVYRTRYDVRAITWKRLLKLCCVKIKEAVLRRTRK